jgi:hypothetical protein
MRAAQPTHLAEQSSAVASGALRRLALVQLQGAAGDVQPASLLLGVGADDVEVAELRLGVIQQHASAHHVGVVALQGYVSALQVAAGGVDAGTPAEG